MAFALKAYREAMADGTLSHDGNAVFARHIANARRAETTVKDEEGRHMWVIRKEGPKSPLKIDLAMAGCLSWEARGDAIAAGVLKKRGGSGATF
ncbi:MAG: phage terminase family protein [Chloroflexi bacterium]|nr:phage terminase family protein [Chloroflexota bacterium]